MEEVKKISFQPDGESSVEYYVLEQTRIGGFDYILLSDTIEGDGEALILKDISDNEDEESIYTMISDEEELAAVAEVFESMLDDVTIEE